MKSDFGYLVMTKGRGYYMIAVKESNTLNYTRPVLAKNGIELWLGMLD